MTRVQRRGRLVGIVDHDVALHEQPQMTEAAVAAVGLAIENAHLYATMQAHLEQIRASRLHLAQTAFDERQRIQRDLHDDAQQRFFTVLMLLDRTGRRLATGDDDMRADAAATVQRAHAELTDAVRALRELTQGIYPAVLIEHGLAAAVENLADRAPLPVSVTVSIGRWPKHVEIAELVRTDYPDVGLLLLSAHLEPVYAERLLAMADTPRAVGYLGKEHLGNLDELVDAFHRIVRGEVVIDSHIISRLMSRRRVKDPLEQLTPHEKRVLALVAEGRSNLGIAQHLGCKISTVERHLSTITAKLSLPQQTHHDRRHINLRVLATLTFLRSADRPGTAGP